MRSSLIELGLLLASPGRICALPGTWRSLCVTGCGLVSAEWEFFEVGDEGRRAIGRASFEPFGKLELDTAKLKEARLAFEQFMVSKDWDFAIPAAA